MSLREDVEILAHCYKAQSDTLDTNHRLLEIQEGNLLPQVLADLALQLSQRAFETCRHRVPPINLLRRVIDKLSTIYAQPPVRTVEGTETDQEMWAWYLDWYQIDVQMQLANEYFNMQRATALEPYLDNEFHPRLRVVPYDRFFVYAKDLSDPLRVTHFVKCMGKTKLKKIGAKNEVYEVEKMILYAYTDDEFIIFDEDGEVLDYMMRELGADGTNPIGKIPFVYINKSFTQVNPRPDTDLLAMTKLIPIMITDINYALMFQSFSIWYTIDVEDENFFLNPNTIISMKSDPTKTTKPEIGSIKPELDSDKAFAAIKEQLSLWLQSRGIRPGSTGELTAENMSSGISKMVDEMDTTNERKKTIPFFVSAEKDLFELVTEFMHPYYTRNPSFEYRNGFTADMSYSIKFSDQVGTQTRTETINEVEREYKNRFISQQTAIERLNPEWAPEQVQEEIGKINGEMEVTIEVPGGNETSEV
jgi:hypothetical protein